MGNTRESGHQINVALFDILKLETNSFGTDYNPSKQILKQEALHTLSITAKAAISLVTETGSTTKIARHARIVSFKQLNTLITRVNNAMKATDANTEMKKSVASLSKKIQGKRITPKMSEEEKKAAALGKNEIHEHSSSQMGFDNRLANFAQLISLLSSIPSYTPNETELKTENLNKLLEDLNTKNKAVVSAEILLGNARIARNKVLYHKVTGLVDVANDVKSYTKSVFGASSPQYRSISKLKFTRLH